MQKYGAVSWLPAYLEVMLDHMHLLGERPGRRNTPTGEAHQRPFHQGSCARGCHRSPCASRRSGCITRLVARRSPSSSSLLRTRSMSHLKAYTWRRCPTHKHAAEAGRAAVHANRASTSQTCNQCGSRQPMPPEPWAMSAWAATPHWTEISTPLETSRLWGYRAWERAPWKPTPEGVGSSHTSHSRSRGTI
jgi:hypothetical protein